MLQLSQDREKSCKDIRYVRIVHICIKICNVLDVDHKSSIHSRHLPLLPCAIVMDPGPSGMEEAA